ncbi:coxsackievirus and adenovirus receptor homolog isoform X2 [Oreochromis aureus]|uniref:coxsackievirus and adenovirus receptor homolog isoform X2 n=1 Tax=Oreochromis aureus TaxID=47969 RepID=UPI001952D3CB|nr:coxsackievirus and adenovirus receptor homolog isoform X2 [Oreochromis aureus]
MVRSANLCPGMAVLITASHLWILSSAFLLEFTSTDQKNITAKSGQDVTLTCRAPDNKDPHVQWSRADLKEDKLVFVYRNKMPDPENQHPSFKNRVDLQDRQMKDGDVSLILKNVTTNDTGTYNCRVQRETESMKLINSTYLHVVPPGQTGGHTEDGGKEDGGKEDGVSRGCPVARYAVKDKPHRERVTSLSSSGTITYDQGTE